MKNIKNSTDSTLGARILERVESLAEFSESPSQLTRQYLSEEHHQANGRVAAWMREAGMKVRVDAVGNIIGRLEADDPDAPCLMLGSHLDTVRNAGRYDGTLGVVLPICCIDALRERGQKPSCHIEIIGFGDEEGARYVAGIGFSREDIRFPFGAEGAQIVTDNQFDEPTPAPQEVVDALRPGEIDIVGQIAVGAQQPAARIAFTVGIEMRDLGRCMHAGVRAASTGNFDVFIGDRFYGVFDERLNTQAGTLTLPAVVRRTVVLQPYCDAHRFLTG